MNRASGDAKDLRARIAALSPEKRALLERRLTGAGAAPPGAGLPQAEPQGRRALSYAQQRLWFLEQLEPGSAVYNVPRALRLVGALDVDTLRRALDTIVARHESLRTTFQAVDGEPVQVIGEARPVELPLVDLSGWPEPQREADTARVLAEEARRPFDLTRALMLRGLLLRLGPEEHVLLLVVHHIASDGWSVGILLQELAALYHAFSHGAPSPLPPLPIQYADYAASQRQWLQGEPLARQIDYWTRQLDGAPTHLELPTDHRRPPILSSRGAQLTRLLPRPLIEAVKTLARREQATLFMTLLAAFQTLLHRYTGQPDLLVGTAIAGRTHVETEPLIGFFVNTLVLRSDAAGDPPFRDFLHRVRHTALDAYAHQDLPFERLVETLRPERSLDRAPLVQVLFVLQDPARASFALHGLTVTPVEVHSATAKFDLTASLAETPDGLRVSLEYSTDLFEPATMERLLGHYEQLLEGIVTDPAQPLSRLPLLTPPERHQLLVDWNATRRDFPTGTTLHALFEAQATRAPDAIAVVFEGQILTYRELDHRANQLAHHLRSLGVGPDTLVGVWLERSLEMVVAVLGILKAGGAYLPLDPTYPPERLRFMLEDAAPAVLLTQHGLADGLAGSGARLLCLDADREAVAAQSSAPLDAGAGPHNLAYVIYTSGSTGRPKGVMIPHRAACNFLHWTDGALALTAEDAVLQHTPLNADMSVWEIFATLQSGARLVVARPGGHRDAGYLVRLIAREKITVLQLVPSFLHALLEEPGLRECGGLARVICGAEVLPVDLQDRFFSRLDADLYNLYGPTETTLYSTWWACQRGGGLRTVPIGRPIANTQIYLLDRGLQPVPAGLPGEMYIGGAGLARGYLNRPELTAERFIPDPFSDDPEARLYRTGDLARYLPDGAVEFLGRTDHQVKIRGFRIELGEIEAALTQHPSVREAVVLAREDAPGDRRLVAYVVGAGTSPVAPAALRRFLEGTLPGHMVPPHIVTLDRLPLLPNGKVARQALPPPDEGALAADRGFLAPRTPVEDKVAAIWREILHLDRVGIHDNFFDCGGHSLGAIRLLSRVREAFGVDPGLRAIFEAPTVAGLAEEITALGRGERGAADRPVAQLEGIPRRATQAPAPLSFGQRRLWFLAQIDPESAAYNIPWAMRLRGALDVNALRETLTAIVARHEVLRTSFHEVAGEPMQAIARAGTVALPVIDLGAETEAEREAALDRVLVTEARRPFALDRDLMLRALLVRVTAGEHVLLLTLHHVAADGWSLGILAEELAALYEACVAGRPAALPALPIQYADYAAWQRREGPTLDEQLEYWTRQLAGAPPALDLPSDRPRPRVQTAHGARQSRLLPPRLTRAVQALARQEGATLFATLLAAFQVLLHRHSGQPDLVVGTAIAGRTHVETEPLIGFFVNTLALRSDLSGDPPFRDFLRRARHTALGAYAHQDLPFERLVEILRPERSLDRAPLVQVMFVLQEPSRPEPPLPGLTLSRVDVDTGTTKFDLTASLTETPDGLHVSLEYSTDLFEPATMERLLGHYEHLLEGIVTDPAQPLSRLPLLTPAERHQLLVDWNATRRHVPSETTLHALFEAQAARTPDAIAVTGEGQALSYRELDRRANRLAHALHAHGVGPDSLVGLCMERSPALVVALLGILKAGGAYLPLDPTYPPERLRFMLEDAAPTVVVADARRAASLPATEVPVLDLDALVDSLATRADDGPAGAVNGSHLAYVLYTSGSTGRPKGVAVPHRAVTRLVVNTDYIALGPADAVAQLSTVSFDAATFEIWGALLHGARLVIIPKETALAPRDLAAALDGHRITTLFLTTALFNQMAREAPAAFRGVRTCLVGGEAVDPRWMREVLEHAPPARLLHVYGPTETTTFASWYEVESVAPGAVTVPIGRPIANTQIYILDARLSPVPIGVGGELCIGGPGLARGYLNRPELTAERFIPDPFSDDPEARLYRTGDLARFLANGNIEFLGRMDQQVKIRGHRVEPGEIETALGRHPLLREVVVVAPDHPSLGRRLVAYVVADPGHAPAAGELRAFLRQMLPDYMVPAAFVFLDHLPLTANGKVDRAALPEPAPHAGEERESAAIAPRSPLDLLLTQIWEELLEVRPIRITDNFFDLGGHSLLAVRMMDAVERVCGRRLPLATLFEGATIEHLATALVREEARSLGSPVTAIKPSGSRPPFVFLHGDFTGGGFYCLNVARQMDPEQPFWALHPHGLDGGPVPSSIEAMAADHVTALRACRPDGPYLLGGHCNGGLVALEMARQLRAMGQEIPLLVLLDSQAPNAWLRTLLRTGTIAGHLRGLDRGQREELGVLLKRRVLAVGARGRYYRRRARELARRGAGAAARLVLAKLQGRGGPDAPPSVPWTPLAADGTTAIDLYHRAVERYLPRRYPGRITVLRAAETDPGRPDLGWASLADEVEIHVVPGDHLTSITRHAGAVGACLRQCLSGTASR
ncbi:MAG: amino acid adenylation domain-containing protein [Candidatus Rokubacteria bacterium]|nr:amino acid adenylation domain-containing protein [Candidatus Rokubacteria bacterium]